MRNLKLLCVISLLAACNQTKFASTQKKSGESPSSGDVAKGPQLPGEKQETFQLETRSGQLDVVWLIDNSGSMIEEAEQVRRNFVKFLDYPSKIDMKLALISAKEIGSGTVSNPGFPGGVVSDIGVTLPADSSKGHIQLDLSVGSTNALAIAAAASCEESETKIDNIEIFAQLGSTYKICGQDIVVDRTSFANYLESPDIVAQAKGKLRRFFRKNASRAYVIVTDDNANGVTEKNFVDMVKKADPSTPMAVYAFRGDVSKSGCDVARKGDAYDALATATAGQVFDICDADWSFNFSALAKAVRQMAETSFTLQAEASSVISVTLNGKELAKGDYQVEKDTLTVRKDLLESGKGTLVIKYKTKGDAVVSGE